MASYKQDRDLRRLHQAAVEGNASGIGAILFKGNVTVDAENSDGYTAFEVAWKWRRVEAMRALLDAGANGRTAWRRRHGWRRTALRTVFGGDVLFLTLMLDFGIISADETFEELGHCTLLAVAAFAHRSAIVKFLLERGASVDAADADGMTALHWACTCSSLRSARLLLEAGADAKRRDSYDRTPLYVVCEQPHPGYMMLKLLLEDFESEVDARCGPEEWTALVAVLFGQDEDKIMHNIMVEFLLSKGADVNAKIGGGCTPLHLACSLGLLDVATLLLMNGADMHAVATTSDSRPSTTAVMENRPAFMHMVLGYESDYESDEPPEY